MRSWCSARASCPEVFLRLRFARGSSSGISLFQAGAAPWLLFTGGAVGDPTPGGGARPVARDRPGRSGGRDSRRVARAAPPRRTRASVRRCSEPGALRRVALVTDPFHLFRASRLFWREGVDVLPAPTDLSLRGLPLARPGLLGRARGALGGARSAAAPRALPEPQDVSRALEESSGPTARGRRLSYADAMPRLHRIARWTLVPVCSRPSEPARKRRRSDRALERVAPRSTPPPRTTFRPHTAAGAALGGLRARPLSRTARKECALVTRVRMACMKRPI